MKKIIMLLRNLNKYEFLLRFKLVQLVSYLYYKIRFNKYYISNYIHFSVSIQNFKKISMNKNSHIHRNSVIWGELQLGENVSIGPNNYIYGQVIMGDFIMTAPNCMFAGGSHGFKDNSVPMKNQESTIKRPIVIEDDVWIGANSVILDGVKICKGSIVGAGSVVTKDVNPYSIVGGNPAVVIKSRKENK